MHRLRALSLACSTGLLAAAPALAQTAGMELQQGNVPAAPARSDGAALPVLPAPAPASAPVAAEGESVELRGVRIEGNRALSTDTLLAALGPLTGRRFTLAQLYGLAERITAAYRTAGYPLAQGLVPAQRLADGVLTIRVVEGTVGELKALGSDPKVPGAQPFLDAGVPVGAPVRSDTLERTMLLLDDQPGFRVRPVLRPGARPGETDLAVDVERRNRVSGEIGLDNTGNLSTGEYRLRAALNVNSPFRFGDRLSLSALSTDRSLWLGSAEYESPLDATGTRGAVGFSRSSYQLGGSFAALDASGVADTAFLRLSRAVLRSQRANALASVTLAHKTLEQRYAAVGLTRERRSDTLVAAVQFDRRDALGGGGVAYGQVAFTAGRLRLDDASRPLDDATARTAGGFGKANLDLARIQKLPGVLSAYGRASAQWSGGNLDPSEKFGIGGFLGVRAYPLGEGQGDRGVLVQTELRAALTGSATGFAWVDAGRAVLNARPWDAASDSRRSIAGAGLGALGGGPLERRVDPGMAGARRQGRSRDARPQPARLRGRGVPLRLTAPSPGAQRPRGCARRARMSHAARGLDVGQAVRRPGRASRIRGFSRPPAP